MKLKRLRQRQRQQRAIRKANSLLSTVSLSSQNIDFNYLNCAKHDSKTNKQGKV